MKLMKRLAMVATLAVIAAAVMAAPAFASGIKWNFTGSVALKGTVTLKRNGGNAVSCTVSTSMNTSNEAGGAHFGTPNNPIATKCANGEFWRWNIDGEVEWTGEEFLLWSIHADVPGLPAPWKGLSWAGGGAPTFTNGSGTTASHLDFSETEIGITNWSEPITVTGKLEATRLGGLLTLSTF